MNPDESGREPTAGLKGLNSMPLLLPTGGNQLPPRQVMSPIETGDGQRQQDQEVRLQHVRIAEGDEESEEAWCEAVDLLVRNGTFDAPLTSTRTLSHNCKIKMQSKTVKKDKV